MSEQPYDQTLADAIDAEVMQWAPDLDPPSPTAYYRRKAFTDWFAGWDAAVEVAARIAAERQSVPVSDVNLVSLIRGQLPASLGPVLGWTYDDIAESIARAVRAALAPQVPVIPEGWWLDIITSVRHWDRDRGVMVIDRYEASIGTYDGKNVRFATGEGTTETDALRAAIEAAKESDHE